MRDYVYLGSRLLIICVIAAALLAVTNLVTRDQIKLQEEEAALSSVKEILGDVQNIHKIESDSWAKLQAELPFKTGTLYSADTANGKTFVLHITTKGYAGDVKFFVGVDNTGKVLGLRVGENSETAGLGSKIALPDFFKQFDGKVAPVDFEVIDKVSGATYSSKAALEAANGAADIIANKLPGLGIE